jgi:hypothetical protein
VTQTLHERVFSAFSVLAGPLSDFVETRMSSSSRLGADWMRVYQGTGGSSSAPASMTDPAFLLRVMWENWNEVFRPVLGRRERSIVSELREDRNTSLHFDPISHDDADRVLGSIQRLLSAIGAPEAAAVGRSKEALLRERFAQGASDQPGPEERVDDVDRGGRGTGTRAVTDAATSWTGAAPTGDGSGGGQVTGMTAVVWDGPVERAVRGTVRSGDVLSTPVGGRPFEVARVNADGVVLLFGEKRTPTPFRWPVLEGVLEFLRGKEWVEIGSSFSNDARPGTLDEYLKKEGHIRRATAGWVAVLLEEAGVVKIDRRRPARVRAISDPRMS